MTDNQLEAVAALCFALGAQLSLVYAGIAVHDMFAVFGGIASMGAAYAAQIASLTYNIPVFRVAQAFSFIFGMAAAFSILI